MTGTQRLLLTGAAGELGRWLRPRLGDFCSTLRCFDLGDCSPAGSGEEILIGDLADADAVDRAVQGVNAIIHFGAITEEAPFEEILSANIRGTFHIFEAARRHGVRRILYASSNHVTGFYHSGEALDAAVRTRPDSLYGVSKAFGEDLASLYVDKYGLEIACLRLGSAFPEPHEPRHLSTWLSFEDLLRLVRACLSAPRLGFTVVYGVSNNDRSWWNNESASHLGYAPRDNAERFAERILAGGDTRDPDDPAVKYQGGSLAAERLPDPQPR
jgi:uronate dehydrogenase